MGSLTHTHRYRDIQAQAQTRERIPSTEYEEVRQSPSGKERELGVHLETSHSQRAFWEGGRGGDGSEVARGVRDEKVHLVVSGVAPQGNRLCRALQQDQALFRRKLLIDVKSDEEESRYRRRPGEDEAALAPGLREGIRRAVTGTPRKAGLRVHSTVRVCCPTAQGFNQRSFDVGRSERAATSMCIYRALDFFWPGDLKCRKLNSP